MRFAKLYFVLLPSRNWLRHTHPKKVRTDLPWTKVISTLTPLFKRETRVSRGPQNRANRTYLAKVCRGRHFHTPIGILKTDSKLLFPKLLLVARMFDSRSMRKLMKLIHLVCYRNTSRNLQFDTIRAFLFIFIIIP